jgi:small basic protein
MASPQKNPLAEHSTVVLTVPETIHVKLVDAGQLADYDSWSILASFLSTVSVAFLVAAIQDGTVSLYVTSAVLFALAIFAAINAIRKRLQMRKGIRSIRYALGAEMTDGAVAAGQSVDSPDSTATQRIDTSRTNGSRQ